MLGLLRLWNRPGENEQGAQGWHVDVNAIVPEI